MSIFSNIETDLDLNGPVLEYTTQPSDTTLNVEGNATFTVAAQATFPGNSAADGNDAGTITFQWFQYGIDPESTYFYRLASGTLVGSKKLENDSKYSGVTTATLTIADVESPDDSDTSYYCEISYTPGDEYDSAEKGTGTAINEPLQSDRATITVNPTLSITDEPDTASVAVNETATFTIGATLSDGAFLTNAGITYQWYLGLGDETPTLVTDGTYTTQNITSSVEEVLVPGVEIISTQTVNVNKTFTASGATDGKHSEFIPASATKIHITIGGAGGGQGGDSSFNGFGGTGGLGRIGTYRIPDGAIGDLYVKGKTLTFFCGFNGDGGGSGTSSGGGTGGYSDSAATGGTGGNAGSISVTGGGGGGGGASAVILENGDKIVVVGGGGGGGGGARNMGIVRFKAGAEVEPNGARLAFRPDIDPNFLDNQRKNGSNALGAGTAYTDNSINLVVAGGDGQNSPIEGPGGGGAGGGVQPQRSGGVYGADTIRSGQGGEGGRSGYRSDICNFVPDSGAVNGQIPESVVGLYGDGNPPPTVGEGFVNLQYTYTQVTTRPIETPTNVEVFTTKTQNTVISGQGTPTLSITSDEGSFNSVRRLYCVVSHPDATNGEQTSETVDSIVVDNTANTIIVESIRVDNTANVAEHNLNNGNITFEGGQVDLDGVGEAAILYSIYSPNKDLTVEMQLYGGQGKSSPNNAYLGGIGGYAKIKFTLEKNQEYVIAGLTQSVGTPFIYRGANLIACVGQGGDGGNIPGGSGFGSGGGHGGGVNMSGASSPATSGSSGQGGPYIVRSIQSGILPVNGVFGSKTTLTPVPLDSKQSRPFGGRVAKCTRGVYWNNNGISACADLVFRTEYPDGSFDIDTLSRFRGSDGTIIENTSEIARGYKAGYNVIQTAGAKVSSLGGNGGNGATGGNGGNARGGGGGSGYTDGSVEVLDSRLGATFGIPDYSFATEYDENGTYGKVVIGLDL